MTVKISYLLAILLFVVSIYAQAMEPEQKKITLITFDNQTLELARSNAEKSITINNLLQLCTDAPIPLNYPACTKSTLETIFSLVNQPQAAITANLTKHSFETIAQLWEAANYLDIAPIAFSCLTAAVNRIINENNSEQFKQLLEQLKLLQVDLQKLIKKELVDKYIIVLHKRFKSACNPLKFSTAATADIITAAAVSPDGKRALIALADTVVHLKDLATSQTIIELKGHTRMICSVTFSPNANTALTGSEDDTARLWDLNTGQAINVFKGHTRTVISVAISHDGNYALTGSLDTTACLWDIQTGKLLKTLNGHTDAIKAVAFSYDDKKALTGSDDKTACLWDLSTGQPIKVLKRHRHWVTSVALHPARGDYALTGSNDKSVYLWNLDTGKVIKRFKHDSPVTAVQFSPNGAYALTGSSDTKVRSWSLDNKEMLEIFKTDYGIRSFVVSPDRIHILITDSQAYHVPLIPEQLVTSLEQLLVIIKALDIPLILHDEYYKPLLKKIDPKIIAILFFKKKIANNSKDALKDSDFL